MNRWIVDSETWLVAVGALVAITLVGWIFQKGRDLATSPRRKAEKERKIQNFLKMVDRDIEDHKRRLVTCRCGECEYHPDPPESWSMQHQQFVVERFCMEHTGYGHEVKTNYREFAIN